MYGEALLVTLRSLVAKGGWSAFDFTAKYYASFGPGGTYTGYVDSATKGTIRNLMAVQQQRDAAIHPPAGFTDGAVASAVFSRLPALAESLSGDALSAAAEALVTEANPAASAEAYAYARAAAAKIEELHGSYPGSDDNQSNVLAKLPAIVGRYAGHRQLLHVVVEAARQTANNDDAITWTTFAARVLEAVILGATIKDAVHTNLVHLEQPYRAAVEHAAKLVDEEDSYVVGVGKLGQSCSLANVVPAAIYLALRHEAKPTYTEAIRENMLAGGDSNGRAMLLGALVAASTAGTATAPGAGIPADWVARVACHEELTSLAAGIHVPAHGSDHVEVHKISGF
jgi:ADP-ribosylglycohydrolase